MSNLKSQEWSQKFLRSQKNQRNWPFCYFKIAKISSKRGGGSLTLNLKHLTLLLPVTISQLRKRLGCQEKQWPQVVAMVQITVLRCSRLLATCCEESCLKKHISCLAIRLYEPVLIHKLDESHYSEEYHDKPCHSSEETILSEWHYGQLLCDSFDLHLQRDGMVWWGAVGRLCGSLSDGPTCKTLESVGSIARIALNQAIAVLIIRGGNPFRAPPGYYDPVVGAFLVMRAGHIAMSCFSGQCENTRGRSIWNWQQASKLITHVFLYAWHQTNFINFRSHLSNDSWVHLTHHRDHG